MLAVVTIQRGNYRGMGFEYQNRLRSDFMKHIHVPHKVYCITDAPASFYPRTRCKAISEAVAGGWEKVRLFKPGMFSEERILYFDLNTIITQDINEIASCDADFAMSNGAHVMAWKNGMQEEIWSRFAARSDKAWLLATSAATFIEKNAYKPSYLEQLYPWQIAVHGDNIGLGSYIAESAKVICFDGIGAHEVGGWVNEYWKQEAA